MNSPLFEADNISIINGAGASGSASSPSKPIDNNNSSNDERKQEKTGVATTTTTTSSRRAMVPASASAAPAPSTTASPSASVQNKLLHVTDSLLITAMGHAGNYTGTISVATGQPQGEGGIQYDTYQQSAPTPTDSFRNKSGQNQQQQQSQNRTQQQNNANAIESYSGSWHAGRWHGRGTCKMRNGDVFHGIHVHGERHGPDGRYTWSDGIRRYHGDFLHNQRHGHGTYTWERKDERGEVSSVSTYVGSFVKGQRQGHGVYSTPVMEYTGEWMAGKYHGYGVFLVKANGTQYRGHWRQGRKHGYGIETDADGEILHEGTWNDDKPVVVESASLETESTNTATTASSDSTASRTRVVNGAKVEDAVGAVGTYRGILHNDRPQGVGTMIYDGGSGAAIGNNSNHSNTSTGTATDGGKIQEYEGFWEAGFQHGFGRLQMRNGDYYEGQMAKSLKHGEGIYSWKDGRQYSGMWSHNMRHGKGTLLYPNGDQYEGRFHQGKRQGHGRFVFANGSVYEGQWNAGVYHGKGKLVQEDGKVYEGFFEDGIFHGHGVETGPDGIIIYEGIWTRGEPGEGSQGENDSSIIAAALTPKKTAKKLMASFKASSGGQQNTPLPGNLPNSPPEVNESKSPALTPTSAAKAMLAKVQIPFATLTGLPPPPLDDPTAPLSSSDQSEQESKNDNEDSAPCKAVVDVRVWDAQNNPGRYTGIIHVVTQHPHGVGRMVYDDKNRIHEGFWVHGNRQGHGRCLFVAPGDFHEGEYFQNVRHGPGRYIWKDGRRYRGEYAHDERHGRGTFSYPNGDVYDGQFQKGERHGQGTFRFRNGTCVYRGEWRDGRYSGSGVLEWPPSRRYQGEFARGIFHGQGREYGPGGALVREGTWKDGKFIVQKKISSKEEEEPKKIPLSPTKKMLLRSPSDTDLNELSPTPTTPVECPTGVEKDPEKDRDDWRSSLHM